MSLFKHFVWQGYKTVLAILLQYVLYMNRMLNYVASKYHVAPKMKSSKAHISYQAILPIFYIYDTYKLFY